MLREQNSTALGTFTLVDPILVLLLILPFFILYWNTSLQFAERSGYFVHAVGLGADPFAVSSVMSSPAFKPKYHRATAHPLFALFTKPFVQQLSGLMKAPSIFLTSFVGALNIGLFYVLLRGRNQNRFSAALFSALLAVSTPCMLFSSFPETYVFASASLILMLILFQFVTGRKSAFIALLITSIFSAGITLINLLFTVVLWIAKYWKERPVRKIMIAFLFIALFGIGFSSLLILQRNIYPASRDFFSSELVHSNMQFVTLEFFNHPFTVLKSHLLNFLVYNIVAPGIVRNQLSIPGDQVDPYTLGVLFLYSLWFAGCVLLLYREGKYHEKYFLILITYFVLNFAFYLFYGVQPHLYAAHYTFALVAMQAEAYRVSKFFWKWLPPLLYGILGGLVLATGINNYIFLNQMIVSIRPVVR